MKRVTIALVMIVLMAGSSFAFGVPSFGSKSDSAPAVSLEDAMAAQTDLISAYVAGNKADLETKSIIAEALGLKDQAAELMMASESINEGNAKDISATQAKTESAQSAIEEKMSSSKDLSADAKKKVGLSLVSLTKCVLAYKSAADLSTGALDSAQSVVKNAPMTQKLSVKKDLDPLLSIAPKVPGDLTSIVTTATKYVQFAKSAGVEPPSDLTSALGDL